MPFQITARTVLQLGAELISSDAIAFYELIKNAFDAGSAKVEVRVVVRLPFDVVNDLINCCDKLDKLAAQRESLKNRLQENEDDETIENEELVDVSYDLYDLVNISRASLNFAAPEHKILDHDLQRAETVAQLRAVLDEANYIQFSDSGEGMSLQDLESIYLVIGTRSRREQRQKRKNESSSSRRPILGEKGLGRLSVMRLGDGLRVETTKSGETHYNILEVDWEVFSHDSNALLESIEVQPRIGNEKQNVLTAGTTIRIFKLHSQWDITDLERIAREELSKFTDPFTRIYRTFIVLWFNNKPVIISNLDTKLFEIAHAHVSANFEFDEEGRPRLWGNIDYRLFKRQKAFEVRGIDLLSIVGPKFSEETLRSLGPFTVQFYWFNNLMLREVEGIGTMQEVRNLVRRWAGGLMVFRDGFRIYPYGSFNDDWMKIDAVALAQGGYKLNRRQIIGKVDISSSANPNLLDQTNREGLRDSSEKSCLISILKYVLYAEFRSLLESVEKDGLTNGSANLEEIGNRLEERELQLKKNFDLLVGKYPVLKEDTSTLNAIRDTLTRTRTLINEARQAAESANNRQEITLYLAGLGLMVDIVAHELNRSTRHALDTIQTINKEDLSKRAQGLFSTLTSQLNSIQARLKVIDPLGPSGRQHKETFELKLLIKEVLESHKSQFAQENIELIFNELGDEWRIKAVRGMFVQILENLINNSIYWLAHERIIEPSFRAKIVIELNKENSHIRYSDNGPGISTSRCEDVFLPFFTSKPPGDGKGLGLYISREIARYHGASLYLAPGAYDRPDSYNTFVLDLSKMEKSK